MVASVLDPKDRNRPQKSEILNEEIDEFKSIQNYLVEEIDGPSGDEIEDKVELDLDGLSQNLSQKNAEEEIEVTKFQRSDCILRPRVTLPTLLSVERRYPRLQKCMI